jgi:hypothetical protein
MIEIKCDSHILLALPHQRRIRKAAGARRGRPHLPTRPNRLKLPLLTFKKEFRKTIGISLLLPSSPISLPGLSIP